MKETYSKWNLLLVSVKLLSYEKWEKLSIVGEEKGEKLFELGRK